MEKKMEFTDYELYCYSAVEKHALQNLGWNLVQDNLRIFTSEGFVY